MRQVGIVVEIRSEREYLGRCGKGGEKFWVSGDEHITYCVVLPRGRVFDNIRGLKFQVDTQRGDKETNFFWLEWENILEVRTLDGGILFRNWYLCPKCRKVTKLFLKSGPFCRYCECPISKEKNRGVQNERLYNMEEIEKAIEAGKQMVIDANLDEPTKIIQMGGYIRRHLMETPQK
jgi:hypothetical protein